MSRYWKYWKCAVCGKELPYYEEGASVIVCLDNFLQIKYFDDNKSNRFCSNECACRALSIEEILPESAPIDDDEYDWEDDEQWGEDYYGEEDNV